MQRTIRHTCFFDYAPEVVWEYLTDPALLSQWLMENDFKPVVGHQFRFTVRPRVKVGFDGIVYCQVLEIVPFERLSYSWAGGPGNGRITLDSVVTWTLVRKGSGTELTLNHSGFNGMKNYLAYIFMNSGWGGKIRARLTALIHEAKNEHAAS